MNDLTVLSDSIRDTLIRLRDKQAFLHRHQNYYIQMKSRLFELRASRKNDSDVEKIAESALEFNDIIISTRGRVFINIGYEYFLEKNKEEAIAFTNEKLKLISQAVIQFTNKIREAESTEGSIKELISKENDSEGSFEGNEEGLPTIEIREELDHDDNVISSTLRQTQNHKSEKDDKGLTEFENNLRGKLISKEKDEMRGSDSFPRIDVDNIYTFDDLVREMDEQDKMEDQLEEDKYLRFAHEEDEDGGSSIVPGFQARSAFMDEIRKLRRGRLPPPKSILKPEGERTKTKKSVGFAETVAINEVENLKDVNRPKFRNPLQIDDDGTVLTKTEFDSDLFTKLIGAQGPDEIHKKYARDLETREEQEMERIRSKKHVSKFKLERGGCAKRPISNIVEGNLEADEPVSNIIERNIETDEPISDVIERDLEMHTFSSDHTSSQTTMGKGSDIAGIRATNELELQRGRSERKFVQIKPFKSLCKPKRKIKPQQGHPCITHDLPDKKQSETINFSPKIQKAISPPPTVFTPKVDYRALGEDLDSMARAYTLGVYNDDLHEDPGVLVEKLEDFKNYNEQVGRLQDSVKEFQLSSSIQDQIDIDDQNTPLVTDVVENDLSANYDDQCDGDEDLALHPDILQESLALDYRRLKDSLMQRRFVQDLSEKDKQIEPIDDQGNPIKQSRFRSRRLGFRD